MTSIHGYIKFIKSNEELRQTIHFNKSIVIFDGHLLQRRLNYFSDRSLNDNRYCDYTTFAETIKSFLRRLKICEIIPIIVFDGSVNGDHYRKAFRDRIKKLEHFVRNGSLEEQYIDFSPTLRNYVFSSVVRSFGVEIIQTSSSTWTQVTALANKLMCPVVSQRKEFFFMNLDSGLIHDDSLMTSRLHFNQMSRNWFLSAKVLYIKSLAKIFVGLKPEVMPLLAVILHNDFIDGNGYKKLSQDIKEWNESNIFKVLLNWIKDKTLDNCLKSIVQYLSPNALNDKQNKNDEKIRELLQEFRVEGNDSLVREYLSQSELNDNNLKMLAKGDTELSLPNWFLTEYQKGIIRPALMNVVKLKMHILYPQIEDFSQPSSYEPTLTLRRFLYGILRTESDISIDIEVFDRLVIDCKYTEIDSLKGVNVPPLLYISESQELPFLGNIRLLDMSDRRKLFLLLLETTESFINRCKVSLLLLDFFEETSAIDSTTFLIVITRYLIRQNTSDFDWKPSISSLILSIMYYSCRELRSDLKWTNLCKIQGKGIFESQFIHFFAQIQSSLHITNFVNTILGMPFEEGKPYFCLNGIFIYNAGQYLSTHEEYESYLNYLFRSRPLMSDVFNDINLLFELDLNV